MVIYDNKPDANSYTQIQSFIAELVQNRNIAIGIGELDKTIESLKTHKEIIVTYLNMLNALKSKINFGRDDYSLQIEFSWKDVLKDDFYNSYNVNFEYYSVLFNLGVLYHNLGKYSKGATEDSKLKEGIKYFQYAAWVFDKIKQELPTSLPVKEASFDLSTTYLSYV